MKKQKKSSSVIILIVVIVVLSLVGAIFFLKSGATVKKFAGERIFVVEDGSSGKEVLRKLEEEGIIRDSDLAYVYLKYFKNDKMKFKAGSFVFNNEISFNQLIKDLQDESKIYKDTVTITIPEGYFLTDIALKLSEELDIEYNDLISYWDDKNNIRKLMTDYEFLTNEIFTTGVKHYLEGYLFPSTYQFYKDASAEQITITFLNQTLIVYQRNKEAFDNAPSFYHIDTNKESKATIHEIFTLASILEWESGNDEQMQDVSSVFYNRLNYKPIDMLRSSVTACYSQDLGKDNCLLIDKDLNLAYKEDDKTYNTYTKYGLPIGPIANPGESAIYAALHPNNTDYYYFVGDICGIDGKTHFATIKEGNYNISKKYVSCK